MPSARLTQRRVDTVKPRSRAYDVRDPGLKGFGVRILPSGTKRYFLHSQTDGKRIWHAIGDAGAITLQSARFRAGALLAARQDGNADNPDSCDSIPFETVADEVFGRYGRYWKPRTLAVESGAGAPALGSGGTTPFVGDAVAPKGIPSLSFRSSVRLPWPRFQAPAHQTGRADFPHPAFGRDHVFAHGRSRVFNPRRVRPWSCHSLRFEKRTYLPTLTLCFRQNHRRSRFVACRSIAE